jgi:hypothetical protein
MGTVIGIDSCNVTSATYVSNHLYARKKAESAGRSFEPASVYPCLLDPLNFRTTTVPHHGFCAAPDVICQIARFTGEQLLSAVGEYQT